jgi:hypothetical protein
MARNGYRSSAGRSSIARRVINSGPGQGNGIIPLGGYGGGVIKGGAHPSATGFMISSGRRNLVATPAKNS